MVLGHYVRDSFAKKATSFITMYTLTVTMMLAILDEPAAIHTESWNDDCSGFGCQVAVGLTVAAIGALVTATVVTTAPAAAAGGAAAAIGQKLMRSLSPARWWARG